MKTKAICAAAIFFAACQSPALASNMSGSEIDRMISGKKVVLQTSFGAFPLRYNASKRVTGDGTGLGLARFFAPKETGKWWVKSDQLCQKFPTWYRGKTLCFSLQKAGANKLRWRRDDGYSGTAVVQ
jgi:hypothetical protein